MNLSNEELQLKSEELKNNKIKSLHVSPTKQIHTNTSLKQLVDHCKSINNYSSLQNIDTTCVTSMKMLFANHNAFNYNINSWDVSNVIDMSFLFYNCKIFNQHLNKWNVCNVVTMCCMFCGCNLFNRPLNNWNIINVINTYKMFNNCFNFNQKLNNWNNNNHFNIKRDLTNSYDFKHVSFVDNPGELLIEDIKIVF